ncbi:hypothetical protein D3C72_1870190 [compost metagenome]
MHGQIGSAGLQRGFQLLDEQALATHLGERAVQDLVSARGHAQQRGLVAQVLQQLLYVPRLPQGELAFTGGDGQG